MSKGNTNCVSIAKILLHLKEKNVIIFVYRKTLCNLKEGPVKGKFPFKSKGDFLSKYLKGKKLFVPSPLDFRGSFSFK